MAAAARFWRQIPQRYNLIGTKCSACNRVYFPPRYICPVCRRAGKIEEVKLDGKGELVTYSVIYIAPRGFENQAPYIIGIVELDGGARVTTQIVDCDPKDVKIGMPVKAVFRKVNEDGESGVIYYGYKFAPMR